MQPTGGVTLRGVLTGGADMLYRPMATDGRPSSLRAAPLKRREAARLLHTKHNVTYMVKQRAVAPPPRDKLGRPRMGPSPCRKDVVSCLGRGIAVGYRL